MPESLNKLLGRETGTPPDKVEKLPDASEFLKKWEEGGYGLHAEAYRRVLDISEEVQKKGGRALLVGGSVRDFVLERIPKDFDLEIYKLAPEKIDEIAKKFGRTMEVGKNFGIIKIFIGEGADKIDIDLSLPRKDSKAGEGHKSFRVEFDPNMSIEEAARRRDFTINSMAADPLTAEIFDPFGGRMDLKDRVLRVTDRERFQDDPLRVMRGLQFAGRFGLSVEPESGRLMREMILRPEFKNMPKERFLEEWKKLLLKSEMPSLSLSLGMAWGVWKGLYPEEIPPLKETQQESEWHPEGDVWVHTIMAVDEAAYIARRERLLEDQSFTIMLAVLCHDFGKPSTTKFEEGKIRSRGHEEEGGRPARKFLETLGVDLTTQDMVVKLVSDHLKPTMYYISEIVKGKPVGEKAFRDLAKKIHPATLYELALVAEADHLGRGFFGDPEFPDQLLLPLREYPAGKWFLRRARALEIEKSKPPDLIMGRDLLALGLKPGTHIGRIISLANQLRDNKKFEREDVLARVTSSRDHQEAISQLEAELN